MVFSQKLNQWFHSGGKVTRIWKLCLAIFVVGILLVTITPSFGSFLMALAIAGGILATLIVMLGGGRRSVEEKKGD